VSDGGNQKYIPMSPATQLKFNISFNSIHIMYMLIKIVFGVMTIETCFLGCNKGGEWEGAGGSRRGKGERG
jgi:hypothetical protein